MTFWHLSSWKRKDTKNESTFKSTSDEADYCHTLPDVTRSNSSETSTTIHDISPKPNKPTVESFVTLRMVQPPGTPEGLRPRPTMEVLRKELEIDSGEKRPKRDFLIEKKVDPSRMLPPAPSRSWSMPSQPVLSPSAPKTNFFTSNATEFSTEGSLQLNNTVARTAVGSLVAKSQKDTSFSSYHPWHHGEGYDADADRSKSNNSFEAHNRSTFSEEGWDEKKEDSYEGGSDVYYPLHKDPIYLSRTPPKSHPKKHLPLSPFSTNISLDASPSSLAKPHKKSKAAHQDTSFSSGAALLAHPDRSQYDFGPYEDESTQDMHVKVSSDQTHVSGITQSIVLENESREGRKSSEPEDAGSYGFGDDSLLVQKVQNQRRIREEMLLAVVERLQDDVQLVADVFKADPVALQTNWFVETPLDKEGLLVGFSQDNRLTIIRHVSSILDEMDVAQPEDFFLSPSQVQQYMEPHDELQNALSFCLALVQMAVPSDDPQYQQSDGRWSLLPGFRPAMGIIPMESPHDRQRGGDTSVFTLPSASADTPMTSNVSFSTTIASSRQSSRHPNFQVDGLQIRRTIEIVSTLLQKLTQCCCALLEMNGLQTQKSVRVTKDIKRYYQQLLAVDHNMLRSLVDAFELEIEPPSLSQLVSNDDDDEAVQNHQTESSQLRTMVVPPPQVIRSSFPKHSVRGLSMTPRSGSSASHDLFSPQTLDMMSDRQLPATVPEEYDDLRRQTGSVDYDDYEELRDEPETYQRE